MVKRIKLRLKETYETQELERIEAEYKAKEKIYLAEIARLTDEIMKTRADIALNTLHMEVLHTTLDELTIVVPEEKA